MLSVYMETCVTQLLDFKLGNLSNHRAHLFLALCALDNIFQFSFSQNIQESHSNIQVICCNVRVGGGNFIKSFL